MDIRSLLKDTISHEIVNPSEIAEILGISKASVSNMITRGTFVPVKSGSGSKLFLRSDIEAYRDRERGVRYKPQEISADHPLLTILPRFLEESHDKLLAEIMVMYGQLSEENKEVAAKAMSALLSGLVDQRIGFLDLGSKAPGVSWVPLSLSEVE